MICFAHTLVTSAALALLATGGWGQVDPTANRVAWLREHAARIRSIDLTDDDFDDLRPLAEAIGDARVVLLGEASHGDGSTFLAKGRLVKFLHQQKGFDVLVWESGFYECAKAGEALASGASWRDAFDKALLPIWSKSEQCRPVMEYVHITQRGDRPITLAGMGWYTFEDSALFDDVVTFFEAVDPALPRREQRAALTWIKKFLEGRETRGFPKTPVKPPELANLQAMIDLMKRDPGGKLRRKHGERKVGLMRLALENLKGFTLLFNRPRTRGGADDNPIGVLEGRNVVFLAREYFPDHKLMVWAHNGHLMRGSSQVEELKPKFKINETIATGERIHDALGDAVYSIMFVAHGGKTAIWWDEPRELPTPPNGSLEDLMHQAGLKRGFIDLRRLPADHWLRRRLVARPVSHSLMRADWSQVYDGVFYIDTMRPNTSAPRHSEPRHSEPRP